MLTCIRRFVLLLCPVLFAIGGRGAEQAAPAAANPPRPTYYLRQIIIADDPEAIKGLNRDEKKGFVVLASAFPGVEQAELEKRLKAGENRALDDQLLAAVAAVIENYVRTRGYQMASAMVPPQNIADGALRILVLPGKVRSIKFEGNRWFSESLLREKMRIERGGLIQVSELDRSLAWTNASPFRRLRLHVEPVAGTGEADLFVRVQESFPLRLTAGYENTGNAILGWDRYSASLTYGNLWGLDHLVSYQEMSSHSARLLRARAFEYRAPLPWRHIVSFSASDARVNPTFLGGLFAQVGRNTTFEAKYAIPLRRGAWEGEATGSLGFKQMNNNLEFGGTPALTSTIDVASASVGLAAIRADPKGRWVLSGSLTGGPGGLSPRNRADNFEETRPGAVPRYLLGQFWAQRQTALAPGLVHVARLSAQLSSGRLVPSEQFSLGGATTVRGYEERIISGDSGVGFVQELHRGLPAVTLTKRWPQLESTAVAFWDYGKTFVRQPRPTELGEAFVTSVGVGLRLGLGGRFSASLDFARQIEEVEVPGAAHHRLHVKVNLSY